MVTFVGRRSRRDRAFERLYTRHVGDVYRYALAVLTNPADAEDVTQTTFLNAYRATQQGAWPEKPLNWLIAIAHNVCRQRFRQAARRPNEVELLDHDAADRIVEDDVPRADEIRHALSRLAFNQRAALVMRELEGRSYAEIAEVLGLSHAAVEALLFRARRALREQLEETCSCDEAEQAISRQLDGRLSRAERGTLRAHLRACPDCAHLARRMRATRSGVKSLGLIPVPASLGSFFGAGTGGIALKAAAVVGASAVLVGGTSFEATRHVRPAAPAHAAPSVVVAQRAPVQVEPAPQVRLVALHLAARHAARVELHPRRSRRAAPPAAAAAHPRAPAARQAGTRPPHPVTPKPAAHRAAPAAARRPAAVPAARPAKAAEHAHRPARPQPPQPQQRPQPAPAAASQQAAARQSHQPSPPPEPAPPAAANNAPTGTPDTVCAVASTVTALTPSALGGKKSGCTTR